MRAIIRCGMGKDIALRLRRKDIPVYHKTNVLGLQNFLGDKLPIWANNGSCVEDIWKNFKDIIFEGIKCFVPHKSLKPNSDAEY